MAGGCGTFLFLPYLIGQEGKSLNMEQEEMKLSDQLAVDRTALAADRTLMASVRTSISMISFGFTLYKFLQYAQEQGLTKNLHDTSPRNLGLFLITLGTLPLGMAMVEYVRMMRRLGKQSKETVVNASFLTAIAIVVLGLVLLVRSIVSLIILA